ncbi:MAG: hypothetical protein R3A51_13615 [Nannocystaceae bacterium]
MTPDDAVGLPLQFRARADSLAPPDLDAFRRRADASIDASVDHEECGALPGGRALEADAPLRVFIRHTTSPIPTPGPRALPELACWRLRPAAFGWIANVPRTRHEPDRSRRAWVLAACLPLAVPGQALAAVADAPAVQRPAADAQPVEPIPQDMIDNAETDPPAAPPAIEAPVELETQASVRAPVVGPSQAIVDAAWEGVVGMNVILVLKGDRSMRGRVGAVQRDTFTLIQSETGQVLVLPKSGVRSVRVSVPTPLPEKTGTGLLIGGGVLTGVGVPVFITGVVFLGIAPSFVPLHLPMIITGAAALGGGIPMLVLGNRRRQALLRAVQEHRLSPVVSRTRHGWTGGLQFQF